MSKNHYCNCHYGGIKKEEYEGFDPAGYGFIQDGTRISKMEDLALSIVKKKML